MEEFELYIDRLEPGLYKEFSLQASPAMMESESDDEFLFENDIFAQGEATLAGDQIVLNISIRTSAKNSCTICLEPINHDIAIDLKHVTFPIEKAKSGILSLRPYVREQIFLNMPRYSECGGNCPERAAIEKYLTESDDPLKDQ